MDSSAEPKEPSPAPTDELEESQASVDKNEEVKPENPYERVSIPVEFAIKNVWRFVPTKSSCTNLDAVVPSEGTLESGSPVDPDIVFPPGLMADARARFEDAFSDCAQLAALPETKELDWKDPLFTLLSPHEELSITDSFVRQIALSQEADVVVLDSIDLLGGENTLLGKREYS
jgi:hypothetical protein